MRNLLAATVIAIVAAIGFAAPIAEGAVSSEASQYVGSVIALNDVYLEASYRVQAALKTQDFEAVQKEMNTFRVLDAVIGQIDPPDAFADTHTEVAAAYRDMARAADYIDLGLATNDAERVSLALDLVKSSGSHINRAKALLPDPDSL